MKPPRPFLPGSIGHYLLASALILSSHLPAVAAKWTVQNPTPTGEHLESVHFSDAQNGWAVGWSGVIIRTKDGGRSWAEVGSPSPIRITKTSGACISSTTGTDGRSALRV